MLDVSPFFSDDNAEYQDKHEYDGGKINPDADFIQFAGINAHKNQPVKQGHIEQNAGSERKCHNSIGNIAEKFFDAGPQIAIIKYYNPFGRIACQIQ